MAENLKHGRAAARTRHLGHIWGAINRRNPPFFLWFTGTLNKNNDPVVDKPPKTINAQKTRKKDLSYENKTYRK